MLGLAVAATIADLVTFILLVTSQGLLAEGNPIVHAVVGVLGPLLGVGVLTGAKLLISAALIWLRNPLSAAPRARLAVWVVAIVAGCIGVTSNLAAILAER